MRVPPADLLEKMTLTELGSLVLDLRAAHQVGKGDTATADGDAGTEELIL